MRRHNLVIEGFMHDSCKIRKRGCSSSSSTSSKFHNYQFKRTILVGRARGGVRSRSSTPVPTWKTTASVLPGGEVKSPKYESEKSRPVSARKLAATWWELNEMSSPKVMEKRLMKSTETRSIPSGSAPYLSDPSQSPVFERMDKSVTNSRQKRTPSVLQNNRLVEPIGATDYLSRASLMEVEVEPKSRAQTPSQSIVGVRTHLKDVGNALITCKELLKIINRIWVHYDRPTSSMSLVSALHAELEQARQLVNQAIKEHRSDPSEIRYLLKCFAEEKASWKNKQQRLVEAAIEPIAGELEVERKLRRRLESLNKNLGRELAQTKASFAKALQELDSEKRARDIMEQVSNELASDMSEDQPEVVELKRAMDQFADKLPEERIQMKLSEAKQQFEEKTAVDKLKNQLEAFFKPKKTKKVMCGSPTLGSGDEVSMYLSRTHFGSNKNEEKKDSREVENAVDNDDLEESDLHSIELNMDNNNKSFKWTHASAAAQNSRRASVDDGTRGRDSISGKHPRKSTSIQRSMTDGADWGLNSETTLNSGFYELDKQTQRKGYRDELHSRRSVMGFRESILSSPRTGPSGDFPSPNRQQGQLCSSRDPGNLQKERPHVVHGNGSKSRLGDMKVKGPTARSSKW